MNFKLLAAAIVASASLSGCASFMCAPGCHSEERNASSLVDFLYPDGAVPPKELEKPVLHLPLKVGLAFLPSNTRNSTVGLDEAHKLALLEKTRQRFLAKKFVADITVIPDYYLTSAKGAEGLKAVQRLYGVDVIALVSFDQVAYRDDNKLSLGYLTIVGSYVLKGTSHDVSTLVDLAVVDPATRSLVLRAGGADTQQASSTLIAQNRESRELRTASFDAATGQMIENFDAALTQFEKDVREGTASVRVVSANGGAGGGGSFDWLLLGGLGALVGLRLGRRSAVAG